MVTLKQQIAVKKLSEIIRNSGKQHGRITIGRILREAGYSETVCKSPQRVTESKGWQFLMEQHYPDEDLVEAERNQLRAVARDHYIFPVSEDNREIKKIIESNPNCKLVNIRKQHHWKRAYFFTPDNTAIGKSLERIYKLKNKYPRDKTENNLEVEVTNFFDGVRKDLPK